MPTSNRKLILLGPQPEYASLKTTIEKLGLNSPAAVITAGWETEEGDDETVKKAVGVETINLNLFARTEQLFAKDNLLIETLRGRQDELRHLRDAYNVRLNHLLIAARRTIRHNDTLVNLDPERESAIEMVRQLDRQYFVRTSQIIDQYEERLLIESRPLVLEHRNEIAETLQRCGAIVISGGHVAIILNRLKIFGILETGIDLPIIAWSGGAMALAEQVVFFHDSPPQGPGDAELLRAGAGVFHQILPLPNATQRLKLKDRARVMLFARRFNRFQCVILDHQTILERTDGIWDATSAEPAMKLGQCGNVVEFSS